MVGNDSWLYQGRQYHMWFGNGTKPKDAKMPSVAADVLPSLQDRIHNVGHTLVAGLRVQAPPRRRSARRSRSWPFVPLVDARKSRFVKAPPETHFRLAYYRNPYLDAVHVLPGGSLTLRNPGDAPARVL